MATAIQLSTSTASVTAWQALKQASSLMQISQRPCQRRLATAAQRWKKELRRAELAQEERERRRVPTVSSSHFFSRLQQGGSSSSGALPTLLISGSNASAFTLCQELVAKLHKSPEVAIAAPSGQASLCALRTLALADAEFRRQTGFLPQTGRVALQLKCYGPAAATQLAAGIEGLKGNRVERFCDHPGAFLGIAARILTLPSVTQTISGQNTAVERPFVSSSGSDPQELAELLVTRLSSQAEEAHSSSADDIDTVCVRLVGEAAAAKALEATWGAQEILRSRGVTEPLGLAVSLGATLTGSLGAELVLDIGRWTRTARRLPIGMIEARANDVRKRPVPSWDHIETLKLR